MLSSEKSAEQKELIVSSFVVSGVWLALLSYSLQPSSGVRSGIVLICLALLGLWFFFVRQMLQNFHKDRRIFRSLYLSAMLISIVASYGTFENSSFSSYASLLGVVIVICASFYEKMPLIYTLAPIFLFLTVKYGVESIALNLSPSDQLTLSLSLSFFIIYSATRFSVGKVRYHVNVLSLVVLAVGCLLPPLYTEASTFPIYFKPLVVLICLFLLIFERPRLNLSLAPEEKDKIKRKYHKIAKKL
jgi:hypothetical protein